VSASSPLAGIVVIGASLGGLVAIQEILRALPESTSRPIVIAQHRHRDSGPGLADVLQNCTTVPVADAEDSEPIQAGRVYLAPPSYHLLVERSCFRLSTEAPVHYSRPSIDVLFESAADSFGPRVLGIVLTGANSDGAAGSARIRQKKGRVFVQDPATAEAPAMPRAAIAAGADRILSIDEIARYLASYCSSLSDDEDERA
jgi:two-component system, chemotaxis family, protein-glutamate methylesterase/glutaminase